MPCRLILNADDFGLTPGINRAIAELHQAGVLTSTTLMANGPAFPDAVALAASMPTLGVGCHLVFVDGTPVSPPADIPSLLGPDRKTFRPTLGAFVRALFLGRIRRPDVAREAEAQIRKLQHCGIPITHIDTHKHTHLFPQILRPILLAARRTGIPAIRNPFEPPWSAALNHDRASRTRLLQLAILRRFEPSFRRLLPPGATGTTLATTQGTLGIAATGTLDAQALRHILNAATAHAHAGPTYELVCHPGYNDRDLAQTNTRLRAHREQERNALLDELPACLQRPNPPTLIHYGNLLQ